jgi:ABC-type branched-subunit amino acid transport system ATPase component/MFS family permease
MTTAGRRAVRPARLWGDRLGGQPVRPALTLFGNVAIDQFDIAAFGLLSPEIVQSFHEQPTVIGYIAVPQLLLGFFIPVIFGYLGDNRNRVRVVAGGVALWGVSSLLTGLSPGIGLLLVFRLLSVISKGVTTINQSLLADYYPTKARGFAWSLYNAGGPIGIGIGGLAAGALGQALGWRSAFVVLAAPSLLVLIGTILLREPLRGRWEAAESGEAAAYQPPQRKLGPVRSARLLLKTPSVLRLCWVTAVLFAGVAFISTSSAFYYSAVWGVGPFLRGVFATIAIPMTITLSFVFGGVGQRLLAANRDKLVVDIATGGLLIAMLAIAGAAIAPSLPLAVLAFVIASSVGGIGGPMLFLLLTAVVPAHLRTQAFGLQGFFLVLLTPITVIEGLSIGTKDGFRVEMLAGTPIYLVAAVLLWTVRFKARRDREHALAVTLAETRAREAQAAAGRVPVLQVRNLHAGYGNVQILFGVDFDVHAGETVAILGTNGAGKSTLVKAISGLLTPTDGVVLFQGENVAGMDAELLAERGIVMLPGGKSVFPGLTVERNLQLGCYLHWSDSQYVKRARREVLELFPRLGQRLGQRAGTLSGGEQQMLGLAQALMNRPQVLIIDEFSLGLAPVVIGELIGVIRRVQESQIAVVVIEQSINIAAQLASRAYFLEKGEVRFQGAMAELAERTDLVRSIFLEGAAVATSKSSGEPALAGGKEAR